MGNIFEREKEPIFVGTDNEGIETVYRFLKDNGFTEQSEDPVPEDIRHSRILVSGGGGIAASFDKLGSLARLLGGRVSVSRRLVGLGIAPRRIQVGQSGRNVNCDLYIAIGIYGAFQHVVGLNNVKHIIVVNKNRLAPICSLADVVVEGDAIEFIEKMTARLESDE